MQGYVLPSVKKLQNISQSCIASVDRFIDSFIRPTN